MSGDKGASGSSAGAEKDESFEALLARLETIVSQLEGGAKPLDESLALYECGVSALKRCHAVLDKADKRIRLLLQDGHGNPQLKDADIPNRGAEKEKGSARKAQTAGRAPAPAMSSDSDGEDAEDDPGPAPDVQKKVKNSADQHVDSEADTPHNSPTSVKSKPKSGQSDKAGGLLFGSAQ